jgi:hypothetical protein
VQIAQPVKVDRSRVHRGQLVDRLRVTVEYARLSLHLMARIGKRFVGSCSK